MAKEEKKSKKGEGRGLKGGNGTFFSQVIQYLMKANVLKFISEKNVGPNGNKI